MNKDIHETELLCIFNENESACSYGIAIGIIAFFGCIFFFVVDLHFQQISSVKDRKRAVLLDLGFSGTSLALLCSGSAGCTGRCAVAAVPCSSVRTSSPLLPRCGTARVPQPGRTGLADGLCHPAMSSEAAVRELVCGGLWTVGCPSCACHFCNQRRSLGWGQRGHPEKGGLVAASQRAAGAFTLAYIQFLAQADVASSGSLFWCTCVLEQCRDPRLHPAEIMGSWSPLGWKRPLSSWSPTLQLG